MTVGEWLGPVMALVLLSPPPPVASECDPASAGTLLEAARLIDAGDEMGAEERLRARLERAPACGPLAVAFWATTGLRQARHAATRGGPPDLVMPVSEAIDRLDALRRQPATALAAEYAQSALRAAIVAAHDERAEMRVWLAHARDLSDRAGRTGESPRWPLPVPLLEGDLWYEVDGYAEAIDAYRLALDAAPSGYAHRGLARALSRRGDEPGSCSAYRALEVWLAPRVGGGSALDEARAYLSRPSCTAPE